MVDMLAQVTLKTSSAIPADYVVNTFSFDFTNSQANIDAATLNIKDFYDAITATGFSAAMSQAGHVIKWYLHGGAKPNYPQAETGFALDSAPAGSQLPSEVALVMSFQGDRIPGQEQRRRQGRIYLGIGDAAQNSSGRPSSTLINAVVAAGGQLITDVDTDTDGKWTVYSTLNGSSVEVTNGWVDNAWDTQRRRGIETTARTTF